ncbi:MAG: methyltransferase [Treponema sp.]|jgi:16S rRNA G1207 methylase RsmC|nr:methyltransferase [Treponema sp.]
MTKNDHGKICEKASEYVKAFANREVSFKYLKRSYIFSLSVELFSSADIDSGSRLLLKVFSSFLDDRRRFPPENSSPMPPALSVLDAGCGVGVLGICAAGALQDLAGGGVFVRAQDRDSLACRFTEYNARRNGIGAESLLAQTEPLLSGEANCEWDIILTNIPAKAGKSVLKDFVRRSAAALKKDGRVFMVAVKPLSDFFRSCITAAALPLFHEENGKDYTVFVYGKSEQTAKSSPIIFDDNFPSDYPFYTRNKNTYEMEGISYSLNTIEGAPDFDNPGGAVLAAAKLAVKANLLKKEDDITIHGEGQGHFALWLAAYLGGGGRWTLSGRNVLALTSAKAALKEALLEKAPHEQTPVTIIPAADIFINSDMFAHAPFDLTAFFLQTALEANRVWQGITQITKPGGIVITGMTSTEAERFDRKKPPSMRRLADCKRKGFRALMYQAAKA